MKITVFGDSISQGFYDTEKNGWVSLLSMLLQQKTLDCNMETYHSVFNQSISGESTTEVLGRFKNEITPRLSSQNTNAVIFAAGINDAKNLLPSGEPYVELKKTIQNVNMFLKLAKERVDHVIVIGLTRVDESLTTNYNSDTFLNDRIEKYDQAIAECAANSETPYILTSDLIRSEHLADGLHPNAAGHKLIYERVKTTLEQEGIL